MSSLFYNIKQGFIQIFRAVIHPGKDVGVNIDHGRTSQKSMAIWADSSWLRGVTVLSITR